MSVTKLAIHRSPSHPAFGILPAARSGWLWHFDIVVQCIAPEGAPTVPALATESRFSKQQNGW
jgi:hypothetical protein